MEYRPSEARRLRFDPDHLGLPQPWTVHFRGLAYRGEVIAAEAVQPEWGHPLGGGLHFRVVFFTVPRRIASRRIQDRRIAMAVPRRSQAEVWASVGREIRLVRETRERYAAGRSEDALTLRHSMQEREESLTQGLTRRLALSYSEARIYTQTEGAIRARDVFTDDRPESWADHLAVALLSLAYPSPLFEHGRFPYPLDSDTVAVLYRGLFHNDPGALAAVSAFGPGLGLTLEASPAEFNATLCRVFPIIQRELTSGQGEMQAQALLDILVHQHGLIRPLAALCLMAFVRHARGEIALLPGHRVRDRQGRQFAASRISWDLLSEIEFSEDLADCLGTLTLRPSLSWDAALPYATLLVEDLRPASDPAQVSQQEQRLLAALRQTGEELPRVAGALQALSAGLGQHSAEAVAVLGLLVKLCASRSYGEFYQTAQEVTGGPAGLRETLDGYRKLRRLAGYAPSVLQAKSYLDSMTFGREHRDLALERDAISARMDLGALTDNPGLWPSIQHSVERLRINYKDAYLLHHARYHQQSLELTNRIERTRPQVEAIVRFAEIPEMGEPVGTEAPELLKNATSALKTCLVRENSLDLDAAPYCASCLLALSDEAPVREAELLFGAVDSAMREYNRRLSSAGVRGILSHPTREQLDKFINLVQVADPSALVNVLDDEVIEFLRRFLRNR